MDTDDLSTETYDGVLGEAEILTHELTIHFGLLAAECNSDDEYLVAALESVYELLKMNEGELKDLFWEEWPGKAKLI